MMANPSPWDRETYPNRVVATSAKSCRVHSTIIKDDADQGRHSPVFSVSPSAMTVPYFISSLKPRREMRTDGRPLLECIMGLNFVQWAQFFSG